MNQKRVASLLAILFCSNGLMADFSEVNNINNLLFNGDFGQQGFFPPMDENFFNQITTFVDSLSPEDRQEFETLSNEVAGELESFVELEAQKLGVTPEEYFDSEFSKMFAQEAVCLAQDSTNAPGQVVSESSVVQVPAVSSRRAKRKSPEKTEEAASPEKVEPKKEEKSSDKPAARASSQNNSTSNSAGVSHGNWLKKLYYLKEAQKLIADANETLGAIRKKRQEFYVKIQDEVDTLVEDFFKKVGVERGNFNGLVEYLEAAVGQKIAEIVALNKGAAGSSDSENNLVLFQVEERVESLSLDLQNLKQEMESLVDLDKTMSERMNSIEKNIAGAEATFAAMQEDLEKIDQTFSHTEAFGLYNKIEANYEKISTTNKYIQELATSSFEKIKESIAGNASKFEERVSKLKNEVEKLAEKMEKISFKTSSGAEPSAVAKSSKKIVLQTNQKGLLARFFDWLLSWLF